MPSKMEPVPGVIACNWWVNLGRSRIMPSLGAVFSYPAVLPVYRRQTVGSGNPWGGGLTWPANGEYMRRGSRTVWGCIHEGNKEKNYIIITGSPGREDGKGMVWQQKA